MGSDLSIPDHCLSFYSVICLLSRGRDIEPMSSQIAFVEIGHDELVSTAILSLPLNQVRQLSLTGERMCCLYW